MAGGRRGLLRSPIRRITATRADAVSLAGATQEAEETCHFASRQPPHFLCHFGSSLADSWTSACHGGGGSIRVCEALNCIRASQAQRWFQSRPTFFFFFFYFFFFNWTETSAASLETRLLRNCFAAPAWDLKVPHHAKVRPLFSLFAPLFRQCVLKRTALTRINTGALSPQEKGGTELQSWERHTWR